MRTMSAILAVITALCSLFLTAFANKTEDVDITVAETSITETCKYASNGETFHVTVYIPSKKYGKITKSGKEAQHLATCAVDPDVIPLGSWVEVNGLVLHCIDTGSKVKGNTIDIFYDGTKEEALNWIARFGDRHTVKIVTSEECEKL